VSEAKLARQQVGGVGGPKGGQKAVQKAAQKAAPPNGPERRRTRARPSPIAQWRCALSGLPAAQVGARGVRVGRTRPHTRRLVWLGVRPRVRKWRRRQGGRAGAWGELAAVCGGLRASLAAWGRRKGRQGRGKAEGGKQNRNRQRERERERKRKTTTKATTYTPGLALARLAPDSLRGDAPEVARRPGPLVAIGELARGERKWKRKWKWKGATLLLAN